MNRRIAPPTSLLRRPAWERGRYGWRHPARWILIGITALALIGTLLLMLPLSRDAHGGAPWNVALFTATSAATVTGLTVVDTGSYWSPFGQVVILLLLQVGGLGVMTAASLLGLVVAGRMGLRTRLLAQSEAQTIDLGTVRRVVWGSAGLVLIVEAALFVILTARLWLGYGYSVGQAAWSGLFHAVSAFNNGGFGLLPDSLAMFASDAIVLGGIGVAAFLGGLGYPVLAEVTRVRPMQRWSVHTVLTLRVSLALLVLTAFVITVGEWHNPLTLGPMEDHTKLISGAFAAVMPRSIGFTTFDISNMDASSLLFTDLMMIIGNGSGSTAGGIKVTTLAVLVLAVVAEVRGHSDVNVHGRRLADGVVRQAIAVAAFSFTIVISATLAMLEMTNERLDNLLFEVISAFATCGLSVGVTPRLEVPEQVIFVVLMLIGRVGPITFATALALRHTRQAYRNPAARPIVG